MKNAKKLTEKVKSAFTKKYGRTAVEGEKPTFNVSKTYGGTIPYLPGKFKEEYSKEQEEVNDKKDNTSTKMQNKTTNKTKSKTQTNRKNQSK